MAKRKPLRDYRKPVPSTQKQPSSQVFAEANARIDSRKIKRGVFQAQQKHKFDNHIWPSHPTLAGRFHALPVELRAQVFSHVLVQPVKWDVEHHSDCPLRTSSEDITPFMCNDSCAGRYAPGNVTFWRQHLNEGRECIISPWQSKWHPEQTNAYLCSDCFRRVRPRPFPRASSLPCICARRGGLEVLLVCKKWYEEAGIVFYTQNTFAFEDASTFASFTKALNKRWREVISKISLMALAFQLRPDEVLEDVDFGDEDYIRRRQHGPSIWSLLRSLPSLSYLELDHIFLSNAKIVRSMQKLGLRNLKHLRFSERLEYDEKWTSGSSTVWPEAAGRTLVSGGFAEKIARAIKGQRQPKLKESLEKTIGEYNAELEKARKRTLRQRR